MNISFLDLRPWGSIDSSSLLLSVIAYVHFVYAHTVGPMTKRNLLLYIVILWPVEVVNHN